MKREGVVKPENRARRKGFILYVYTEDVYVRTLSVDTYIPYSYIHVQKRLCIQDYHTK